MSMEMNRRAVLRTAAGVAGAASLSPLLAACGGSGSGAGKGGTSSKKGLAAALPAYVPSTVGKPDIASVRFPNGAVTEPGYLTFPAEPVVTVKKIPRFMNGQAQTGGLVGRHLADLTPYLSGDNAKEYPHLAAIPSSGWMSGAWENKLYGIPSSRSIWPRACSPARSRARDAHDAAHHRTPPRAPGQARLEFGFGGHDLLTRSRSARTG
ncbi:hypothetical protein EJ357_42240 [Streptomyces cyaneochromogenes]|uniref:DUF839 domain-containing protein n=1 Tax=Streptomyces cyaneochromogenes TaxID=2496836 RepID=A0A3Q9EU51_9ACTN|nr:hypothetical protein [Streptomyces cyaneochromogenes]AZQ39248.1 hypothetical protein EJ357_42240 [Streptomyces cyaneochromogenes]